MGRIVSSSGSSSLTASASVVGSASSNCIIGPSANEELGERKGLPPRVRQQGFFAKIHPGSSNLLKGANLQASARTMKVPDCGCRGPSATSIACQQFPHLVEDFRRCPRHLINAANDILPAHRTDVDTSSRRLLEILRIAMRREKRRL